MVNRILIRIKVIQLLYSYLLTQNDISVEQARKQLHDSLNKSYELYHALLVMMIDLTRMQEMNIDYARNKYLPTDEELNPNMRFVDNEFIKSLVENEDLNKYLKENPISWKDDVYMHLLLSKITESDIYNEYMSRPDTDYRIDTEFWREILKKIIIDNDDFAEFLETKSLYWNADLDIINTFVLKTMRRWAEGQEHKLLPMYKDKEDEQFADKLFDDVVKNQDKYNSLIDKFVNTDSWDADRIAFMDRVILLTALSEVMNFPKIPTSVTLNEYIELAKQYSTNRSGVFVNGILVAIIKHLKKEKLIVKE